MTYDYSNLLQKKGSAYRASQLVSWSHYADPIDATTGRPAGNSRVWGDAPASTQIAVINGITVAAHAAGLSNHDIAYVLAMARVESGFNPDAAAGTTSAFGLGQFINKTGAVYGLVDSNRWDVQAQISALIKIFSDEKNLAKKQGLGAEYIYKYHHDGSYAEAGGLELSLKKVMPYIPAFLEFVDGFDFEANSEESSNYFLTHPLPIITVELLPADGAKLAVHGALLAIEHSASGLASYVPDEVRSDFKALSSFQQRSDPFSLDLNGNGLTTFGVNELSPVFFDINNSGVRQSVGWLGADDGFLARDVNGNGIIDSGAELFGSATLKSDGELASTGFDAIADLDVNHDGLVDSSDPGFSRLRVWRDLNQDGVSQVNELADLSYFSVQSINVSPVSHSALLDNGNKISDVGYYTKTTGESSEAGTSGYLADVDLAVDSFNSKFTDSLPVSGAADSLPDMAGSGMVRSMREAATQSPELAALLEQFKVAATNAEQRSLVSAIVNAWAATSEMPTTFTGAYAGHLLTVDMQGGSTDAVNVGSPAYNDWAMKLTVLERFNGMTYQPVPADTSAVNLTLWHSARDLLQQGYVTLCEAVYQNLAFQTRLKPYLEAVDLTVSSEGIATLDFSRLSSAIFAATQQSPVNGIADWLDLIRAESSAWQSMGWTGVTDFALFVANKKEDGSWAALEAALPGRLGDAASGELGLLVANHGVFLAAGGAGDDILIGDSGDNLINTGAGENIVVAGKGVDVCTGGGQSDTYVFQLGDGADSIQEFGKGVDAIYFGVGIKPADITLSAGFNGRDLIISHSNGFDSITVLGYFMNPIGQDYKIEKVQFSDGTVWGAATLLSGARVLGSASADYITGTESPNTIQGGAGDDVITGGVASDAYFFNLGDGSDSIQEYGNGVDVIKFGAGIKPEDITLSSSVNNRDLIISHANGSDKIIVLGYFMEPFEQNYRIERIQFADGTVWVGPDLAVSGISTLGTAGNDILRGADYASDVIYGQDGDDVIYGYSGSDKLFGEGGSDQIDGGAGNDKLYGGTAADNIYGSSGDDLLDGGDGNDVLIDDDGSNTFLGGEGNDVLGVTTTTSFWGPNVYQGGAGNDTIYGSRGADTYAFNLGDGQDIIRENPYNTGVDVFRFGVGITTASWAVARVGDALVMTGANGVDKLTFDYWFQAPASQIKSFVFADGSTWSNLDVNDMASAIVGTSGNDVLRGANYSADVIYGGGGDDVIYGYSGNDKLLGEADNDQIDGGAGNDKLYGGTGADYLYGVEGDDLLDGGEGNDTLIDDDGSNIFQGGAGNDVMGTTLTTAFWGPNTYNGGSGNDVSYGSRGADTYLFNLGDGQDIIRENPYGSGTDVLKFGPGMLAADWNVTKSGYNLVLAHVNGLDKLTIENWDFSGGSGGQVERFDFADGTAWTATDVTSKALAPVATMQAMTFNLDAATMLLYSDTTGSIATISVSMLADTVSEVSLAPDTTTAYQPIQYLAASMPLTSQTQLFNLNNF